MTAMEAMAQAGNTTLKPENLLYNMLFMTAMHSLGAYTRFMPAKSDKKAGTALSTQVRTTPLTAKEKLNL